MKVDFLNLKRQYETISSQIEEAVLDCLRSTAYIEGPKVKEFEKTMGEYLNVSNVITCANGTEALELALQACGVTQGDEVITTPFSFFATAEAIAAVGAVPVFADVKADDYNLDPEKIEAKITAKTKAILPVHIFGVCADMEKINAIAKKHGLMVIEDAAQAIGATDKKGKKAGSFGDVGCFSFYPTKNLGACGDAGMVTTNNDDLANAARALKAHGAGKIGARAYNYLNTSDESLADEIGQSAGSLYDPYKYYNYIIGRNSRMDSIQAAVLLVKIGHLQQYNAARKRIAQRYNEAFASLPEKGVQLPTDSEGAIWHQYAFMVPDRDKFTKYMTEHEIGTGAFYPVPLHLQKAFLHLGYQPGDCPEAEHLCRHSVCLPIFPELTEAEQSHVINTVKQFFAEA